jgi:putative phosphoesterase
MTRILLLSDTHSYWDDRYAKYAAECDEIWHVGDIGTPELAEQLAALKPLRAVYGNIDGADLRRRFPEVLRFRCEEAEVLMKHIGGYPGKYDRSIVAELFRNPPDLFISGHSHILKVMRDQQLGLLHLNPGAAGLKGFHKKVTMLRFQIDGKEISKMEIYEADRY